MTGTGTEDTAAVLEIHEKTTTLAGNGTMRVMITMIHAVNEDTSHLTTLSVSWVGSLTLIPSRPHLQGKRSRCDIAFFFHISNLCSEGKPDFALSGLVVTVCACSTHVQVSIIRQLEEVTRGSDHQVQNTTVQKDWRILLYYFSICVSKYSCTLDRCCRMQLGEVR